MAHHFAMQFSDLSSEGLARLEAKLLADVEVVRRMRALLEEHRGVWEKRLPGSGPAGAPGAEVPAAATLAPPVPVPSKSLEELALECLLELPAETFVLEDLRGALRARRGTRPKDTALKSLMNRLGRTGKVVVEELRRGRGGSLYRCTLPRGPVGESPDPAAKAVPSPVAS
jgi:hypothetical protein